MLGWAHAQPTPTAARAHRAQAAADLTTMPLRCARPRAHDTEYRGHTREHRAEPPARRHTGRTLAAARESVIKAALRQVPAGLSPHERAARVKALAAQLWAARHPGTPFPS